MRTFRSSLLPNKYAMHLFEWKCKLFLLFQIFSNILDAKCEFLTAILMKFEVFCDVMPYRLVNSHQSFAGKYCFHFHHLAVQNWLALKLNQCGLTSQDSWVFFFYSSCCNYNAASFSSPMTECGTCIRYHHFFRDKRLQVFLV